MTPDMTPDMTPGTTYMYDYNNARFICTSLVVPIGIPIYIIY